MPSILIIDDETNLRETLADLFASEGFRVHVAADGDQGIRIARAQLPDIILSDVRMPGISGHEAVKALRQIPGLAANPIILITGNADLADMHRGMAAGADDYLAKPFKIDDLLATIQRHLDRSQTRRNAAKAELIAHRRHTGTLLPGNLNDPLHEIIGCASVLEADAQVMSPNDITEFSRSIINGAETLKQRIQNFVLYSRLTAHSLVIPAPAAAALHEALTTRARQIARRHHRHETLRFDCDEVVANVNLEFLIKAVAEIIDNACRYSLLSEPIDISLQEDAGKFTIKVTDFGMGLSDKQLTALDDEDTITSYGMKLSRLLTTTLGGRWELDNRVKKGLTVSFTFSST
jgi:two-component system, sensor histidine kinase and response regulator